MEPANGKKPRWALAAAIGLLSSTGGDGACSPTFGLPSPNPPLQAGDYNGYPLPDVCIADRGYHNVFLIGDWGGLSYSERTPPVPADKRSKLFPRTRREFVYGVDDTAQILVAEKMRELAVTSPPDYILNVGDDFYWGGVKGQCGAPPFAENKEGDQQWLYVFENVYFGRGLSGKPWLGVLGNHDYGGFHFGSAWDQIIGHSWGKSNRWFTPAQFYSQKVNYWDFSVDYYFIDSNIHDAWEPQLHQGHNICGAAHNLPNASCGPQGPVNLESCYPWFADMWEKQLLWLEDRLDKSTAQWQMVVTHFPPYWGDHDWRCIVERHGIDVFISGHVHSQHLTGPMEGGNYVRGTTVVVTGGGGGITSEKLPDSYGQDDEYGFMLMQLASKTVKIDAISHKGIVRKTAVQQPRAPVPGPHCTHFVPMHFVPVDGGEGRGCRGASVNDNSGKNFMLFQDVPTIQSCMRHCKQQLLCKGIEYGQKVCELWTSPIGASVPMPGFFCLRLDPGAAPDPQLPPDSPAPAASGLFATMGVGHACHGEGFSANAGTDFDATTAPTIEGCIALCKHEEGCQGIQYGPGQTCDLWKVHIVGSSAQQGVTCVPAGPAGPSQAGVAEAGGLLHV